MALGLPIPLYVEKVVFIELGGNRLNVYFIRQLSNTCLTAVERNKDEDISPESRQSFQQKTLYVSGALFVTKVFQCTKSHTAGER
jgi:hypothetical protein